MNNIIFILKNYQHILSFHHSHNTHLRRTYCTCLHTNILPRTYVSVATNCPALMKLTDTNLTVIYGMAVQQERLADPLKSSISDMQCEKICALNSQTVVPVFASMVLELNVYAATALKHRFLFFNSTST